MNPLELDSVSCGGARRRMAGAAFLKRRMGAQDWDVKSGPEQSSQPLSRRGLVAPEALAESQFPVQSHSLSGRFERRFAMTTPDFFPRRLDAMIDLRRPLRYWGSACRGARSNRRWRRALPARTAKGA